MAKSKEKEVKWYIKKELEKGFPIDDVREALVGAGHSEKIVNKAIEDIGTEEIVGSKGPRVNVKYLVATLIIVVIVAVGIYSVRFLPTKAPEEKGQEVYEAPKTSLLENKEVVEFVRGQMERCLVEQAPLNMPCMALLYENSSFCEMDSMPTDCYQDYHELKGILMSNRESCTKLENPQRKEFCGAFLEEGIEFCSNRAGDELILCNSIVKKDVNLCDGIRDTGMGGACKNYLYFLAAYKENDKNVCNRIKNENFVRYCLAIINEDPSFCAIGSPSICRDMVYFRDVYLGLPQLDTSDIAKILGTS